ncbi:MAG: hypothetical protein U5K37_12400 [Natrialbaceae archaeon]|nr:hypothetical protein [Natrialbaceae archaeon]
MSTDGSQSTADVFISHPDQPRLTTDTSLEAQIERTMLETRAAALERSLQQSERRRQAVVQQYERLIDEAREEARSDADRSRIEQWLERIR